MATYTPNLNLGKPEATDPFGNFRQLFNDNMDILDNGGGGGSGGHTIYDENGSAMPQETGLQFTGNVQVTDDNVNGKTIVDILGGGGNVYGAFIDTNRLLASGNIPQGSSTYTATEDCALLFTILSDSNNSAKIEIDGVKVWEQYDQNGINSFANFLLVRSGQTVTFTQSYSSNGSYKAYGLTQGTNGIFTPIIYSDTERVVGVWRDNKPLYQKSVYVGSLSAGSGVSLAHGIANIDTIANYEGIGFNTVESRWNTLPRVDDDVTYQRGLAVGSSNIVIWGAGNVQAMSNVSVTIWYTKTTDVAGSGNWNTDGVPTVHYSTSEQVIGTFFGKPLYQKSWDLVSGILISYNAWTGTSIDSTNMENIVSVKATHPDGTCYEGIMADPTRQNHTLVGLQTTRNGNDARARYVTLQYTKVTD